MVSVGKHNSVNHLLRTDPDGLARVAAVTVGFFRQPLKEDVVASEVYYQLREQLDQYSVGFPATETGVEIKILEHLFTEEEAQMYLNLSMMLETPEAVADLSCYV